MIKIGQKVKFDLWSNITNVMGSRSGDIAYGTVIYVNNRHNYFTVEYPLGNEKFRTCFHFVDMFGDRRTVFPVKG